MGKNEATLYDLFGAITKLKSPFSHSDAAVDFGLFFFSFIARSSVIGWLWGRCDHNELIVMQKSRVDFDVIELLCKTKEVTISFRWSQWSHTMREFSHIFGIEALGKNYIANIVLATNSLKTPASTCRSIIRRANEVMRSVPIICTMIYSPCLSLDLLCFTLSRKFRIGITEFQSISFATMQW